MVQDSSKQMLDLVDENSLGVLAMPTTVAASTDQKSRGRIDHCRGVSSYSRISAMRRTHL